nr:MAG TPA: large terminase protein [Caudoviricetes sp.]
MAKTISETRTTLTREELSNLSRVSVDVFYFSLFCNVIHPVRGKVRFELYPFQKSVLYNFIAQRFNIILKFRQAGITELISMYCLWLAMYHPNKKINIISIKDTTAKKVLKKIKFMYKNLPWYLQTPIINGRTGEYGSASMIEFDNGSFIESIPTSSEAGRSESLSLLVIDEAAVVRWAAQIWAAAFPTLSTGGAAIVNSTPYGVGNFYHSTWVDAIAGGNPFNPIRLYWQMHPERDINWYNQMSSALGTKRTAQEIDGDFLSSGNTVFDLADIKAIEDCLSDYPVIKKRFNGQYRQFCEPEPDKEYFIGADVATGRSSDYSSFTVMDKPGEEQAVYKGRMAVGAYAKLLGDTGMLFNQATIAPESNDVGLAVTSKLQDEGYPKLYYYQKMLKKKGKSRPEMDKSPGWLTTQKNRSVIIENLEEDIRNDEVIIKDPFFVQEAYTFIYDGLGRPVAMGKHRANNSTVDVDLEGDVYADDDIFGKAICNHIRKGKTNVIVQPR